MHSIQRPVPGPIFGQYRGCCRGGPEFAVAPGPPFEQIAESKSVIERHGDEWGGHVSVHTCEFDADLLHVSLIFRGGDEAKASGT